MDFDKLLGPGLICAIALLGSFSFQSWAGSALSGSSQALELSEADHEHNDFEDSEDEAIDLGFVLPYRCTKATKKQILEVNEGAAKLNEFLSRCAEMTRQSQWCQQLTRPNPASRNVFNCTYGESQPHILIHPDESTWKYAIQAVTLIQELQSQNINVRLIYNWWRPAPYNQNVGGAAGRHPLGTSVDVRFTTLDDMERAHTILCQWRAQGRVRAIGYYGSTGLHFGIGDRQGNTWGKTCD